MSKAKHIIIAEKWHDLLTQESFYTKTPIKEIVENILERRYSNGKVIADLQEAFAKKNIQPKGV